MRGADLMKGITLRICLLVRAAAATGTGTCPPRRRGWLGT